MNVKVQSLIPSPGTKQIPHQSFGDTLIKVSVIETVEFEFKTLDSDVTPCWTAWHAIVFKYIELTVCVCHSRGRGD